MGDNPFSNLDSPSEWREQRLHSSSVMRAVHTQTGKRSGLLQNGNLRPLARRRFSGRCARHAGTNDHSIKILGLDNISNGLGASPMNISR